MLKIGKYGMKIASHDSSLLAQCVMCNCIYPDEKKRCPECNYPGKISINKTIRHELARKR